MSIRRSEVVRRAVSVNLSVPGQDGQVMSDLGVINSRWTCFHLRWHLSSFKSALGRPPLVVWTLQKLAAVMAVYLFRVLNITLMQQVSVDVSMLLASDFSPFLFPSSNVTLHRCWIWCLVQEAFLFLIFLLFFCLFVKLSKTMGCQLRSSSASDGCLPMV